MKRYLDLNSWLKEKFGGKVYKVSLTANTTCPNIDGSLAKGGCTFCNDASYSPMHAPRREKSISLQLAEGMEYVRKRHHSAKFIAYFQSFTSTYGDMKKILEKFEESLIPDEVVGLALSTRPDCLTKEWVDALKKLAQKKFLWIEIGLQSANNKTLARINRCHTREQFSESLKLFHNSQIPICAHVVLGLPGENKKDALETARFLAAQPIHGIKIHNLHVVKGTQLALEYLEGKYKPITLEEYVDWTVDFLENTPAHFLIHRLNAHAPRELTLAPDWSVNKLGIFNAVEKELKVRDSWQGKGLGFNPHPRFPVAF